MIVVDSNVLAYLYLPGEFTEAAERLLEDDPDWHVPLLWRSEFRNILAGCLRRDLLEFEQAQAIQHEAEALLDGAEHVPESRQVLERVRDSECSAYDCEFIALAAALGTQLVTMDHRLLKAFPTLARPLGTAC
ncbi:type II toxin-antitoxin system VapC family toxin [Thermomonas sp.]|uniref:type II toxin-antitoxin system VapC family toxin n=1 Tax=Thermomonas sp. TaxID=1971895 RepID=UPI002619C72C|nr:type II toxin-antitoxin system VapC family toxin [Thermomonas sp.]